MSQTSIRFNDAEFYARPGTWDEAVIKEVFKGEYKKLQITPDDVVLDIGSNIGCFSIWACQQGCKNVIGFEPEPDNFRLATMNLKRHVPDDSRYTMHECAVVGNDDSHRRFYVNVKKNKGLHSLIPRRGRKEIRVACRNINEIIHTYQPTIVKCDIEGGEYELIRAITCYGPIRQFIFEWHHECLKDLDTHEKYEEIKALLRTKFDVVDAREETKKTWTDLVYCHMHI